MVKVKTRNWWFSFPAIPVCVLQEACLERCSAAFFICLFPCWRWTGTWICSKLPRKQMAFPAVTWRRCAGTRHSSVSGSMWILHPKKGTISQICQTLVELLGWFMFLYNTHPAYGLKGGLEWTLAPTLLIAFFSKGKFWKWIGDVGRGEAPECRERNKSWISTTHPQTGSQKADRSLGSQPLLGEQVLQHSWLVLHLNFLIPFPVVLQEFHM